MENDQYISAAHVAWSRNMFSLMAEGGVWGVPRSGLLFRKEGNKLILISRMPYDSFMPVSKEQLLEFQKEDYEIIKLYFGLAGIEVISKLNGEDNE